MASSVDLFCMQTVCRVTNYFALFIIIVAYSFVFIFHLGHSFNPRGKNTTFLITVSDYVVTVYNGLTVIKTMCGKLLWHLISAWTKRHSLSPSNDRLIYEAMLHSLNIINENS